MAPKNQSEILKKYWEGKSTLEEEQCLKNSALLNASEEDRKHFTQLKEFSKFSLGDSFEDALFKQIKEKEKARIRILPKLVWRIAAAVLIGLSLYYLSSPVPTMDVETELVQEEDPEKAFELTKQALLLVSTKLNKAAEHDLALNKFEEVQTKIKVEGRR